MNGNDDKGWILTSTGLNLAKFKKIFSGLVIRKKRLTKIENYLLREEYRIVNSDAYIKLQMIKKKLIKLI